MKAKLSVFIFCVCSMFLLVSCNHKQPQQPTSAETLAQPIKKFISEKYPKAEILEVDKNKNGTEVDIQDKDKKRELWFDLSGKWVSTNWEIGARDVPVAIMDALVHSAYSQYKVEDITAVEKREGMFYEFKIKQDNNEVRVVFDSKAQVVVQQ